MRAARQAQPGPLPADHPAPTRREPSESREFSDDEKRVLAKLDQVDRRVLLAETDMEVRAVCDELNISIDALYARRYRIRRRFTDSAPELTDA
jgi:hypothetical protein